MTNEKTPIDQLESLLGGGFTGWNGLDDATNADAIEANYEASLKNYQNAKALVEGISPAALAILHDVTQLPPTWDVESNGLINAIGYGIFREGQKSIYQYIETAKQIVEAGPPETPQTLTQNEDESS